MERRREIRRCRGGIRVVTLVGHQLYGLGRAVEHEQQPTGDAGGAPDRGRGHSVARVAHLPESWILQHRQVIRRHRGLRRVDVMLGVGLHHHRHERCVFAHELRVLGRGGDVGQ